MPVPKADVLRGPGWPSGEDWEQGLAAHYATARRMLGATTNPRLTRADEILKEAATELGFGDSWHPTEVGVYFGEPEKTVPDPYFGGRRPERSGCRFCGGCMVGCRTAPRTPWTGTTSTSPSGLGVAVYPETTVDRLEALPDGAGYLLRATARPACCEGAGASGAPRVILSAGVLGTLRLLLRARDEGTLPRLSPAVGLRVRTNSEALVGATSRRADVDLTDGVAITSSVYPDPATHVEPVRYPRGSDAMGLLGQAAHDGGPGMPRRSSSCSSASSTRWTSCARSSPWLVRARRSSADDADHRHNHLRVLRRRRWWWPFSRALTSRPSEDSGRRNPSYIPVANELARRVARKIDGWPVSAVNEVLLDVPTTAHVLGGAAIGDSPQTAVCDARHQVFGHPGLYVVDGSSVPVNLGVNPSLTITAMARRR
jgi:cholesterol oxidase